MVAGVGNVGAVAEGRVEMAAGQKRRRGLASSVLAFRAGAREVVCQAGAPSNLRLRIRISLF